MGLILVSIGLLSEVLEEPIEVEAAVSENGINMLEGNPTSPSASCTALENTGCVWAFAVNSLSCKQHPINKKGNELFAVSKNRS